LPADAGGTCTAVTVGEENASSREIVPGATHLFEEPSTLDQVARLARDWFVRHPAEAQTAPQRPAA